MLLPVETMPEEGKDILRPRDVGYHELPQSLWRKAWHNVRQEGRSWERFERIASCQYALDVRFT